jgi:8-oxo-dGTP pyrophosphatase MutT (NUDIX family)
MFRYCPSCGKEGIRFERNKVFRCNCGFTYYHNNAAASGCIIRSDAGLLFLVRGKDPARGKLDLPGGFVDAGEGLLEGLRRECIEELGWDPGPLFPNEAVRSGNPSGRICRLFASFPNVYPYKGIVYSTCDIFFLIDAPELSGEDLKPDPVEVSGSLFIKCPDIKLEDLAFESTRRVVETYLYAYKA